MKTIKGIGIGTLIAVSLLVMTGFVYHVDQLQTTLRITPEISQIRVGETATVDLRVEQVSGLYGAEIHLRFDPDVLEVVDADPAQAGIQLEPGTLPIPDFVVQNQADNTMGVIDYAATQLPPNKPREGGGVIARVTFRAKKVAVSQIQFEQFLLADTTGSNIDAVPQHARVKVLGGSTWMLIAASGIASLLIVGSIVFVFAKRK